MKKKLADKVKEKKKPQPKVPLDLQSNKCINESI